MQFLTQRSIAQTRCEPGACFVVTIAIVENEKALHASMHGGESTEVAHGVRFGGMRLRDSAAQNHARVLAQMRERCIESGSADIVEVEIHTVGTSARNRVRDILFSFVIDRGMCAEGARYETALLRPACDADHAAPLYARNLHGDLPDSARSGRDEHAIVGSHAGD